jgi:hypothetical protein
VKGGKRLNQQEYKEKMDQERMEAEAKALEEARERLRMRYTQSVKNIQTKRWEKFKAEAKKRRS